MFVKLGQFKGINEFERIDQTTGARQVDRSFSILAYYPDGQIHAETIYFPKKSKLNPVDYQPPELELDTEYAFPISIRPRKDGHGFSMTALPTKMPFPAPKRAI